jgi:hypothetical protein
MDVQINRRIANRAWPDSEERPSLGRTLLFYFTSALSPQLGQSRNITSRAALLALLRYHNVSN